MSLAEFFKPRSVAIVGASHTPGKVGNVLVDNFSVFDGDVYYVNRDTSPINGKGVYESVTKIPGSVDLAVIAVPAKFVPGVISDCKKKGIGHVIIISSGFSETGQRGSDAEEEIRKILKQGKIRAIGPNVVGVLDTYSKVDTIFLPKNRMGRPGRGKISFITQSGAVGSTVLDFFSEEGIGVSKFISYGNAMDVNETDLLEYLGTDDRTRVIACYIEGIKSSGHDFMKTSSKVSMRKPIIVLKGGKTDRGTRAVSSHTGSLAGSSRIYSAAFKQSGIVEAADWEEMFDFSKAFAMQPLPKGDRLMIVTNGGGFGILAVDEAERRGLKLDDPSKASVKKISGMLPPYASIHNPIDLAADSNSEKYHEIVDTLASQYDGFVLISLLQVPSVEEGVAEVIVSLQKFGKPILAVAAGSGFTKKVARSIENGGVPVYPTPERAVRSFKALLDYSKFVSRHGK